MSLPSSASIRESTWPGSPPVMKQDAEPCRPPLRLAVRHAARGVAKLLQLKRVLAGVRTFYLVSLTCEYDRVGGCAGRPCADRLPLVPGGNAAGAGAEGRTPHPGVPASRRRSGPEDRRRWPVPAGVLARPAVRPGRAGSTAVGLGRERRAAGGAGGAGGGRSRLRDERVPADGAPAAGGPGGDRRGGR